MLQFEFRAAVEPEPVTGPVRLAGWLSLEGFQVGFDGAFLVRGIIPGPEAAGAASALAERWLERFRLLLSARTGLFAAAGARTITLAWPDGREQAYRRLKSPGMGSEYELEPEPWVSEVAWSLMYLPVAGIPAVQAAVECYAGALDQDRAVDEAALLYQFGRALAGGLAGREAEMAELTGVDALTFRTWLAGLGRWQRYRAGQTCDPVPLRTRLIAQAILNELPRWGPELREPVAASLR